ncbi:MAG: hypothetical protein A2219_02315 [Elusimicrobia bacterium RIFOXYA2_FULL_50_26]|nr:MAG: hypothetical protein A2219_02315 [Elusimicrobia bacterium RIFOXYA2_FULL_50_26]OGS24458.1 MAG: hypothetical protein A2314_06160 [Elusimicrobia bacterium RIFOXYB2_FULL_50_12]
MKRFICLVIFLSTPTLVQARINVFEPWFPGQDSKIYNDCSYQLLGSFIAGERLIELPLQFSYFSGAKTEVGGRWGLVSVDGRTGISDLIIGGKYAFLEESHRGPAVIGEAALILPTADSKNGLGQGSVGALLHWALEKKIEKTTGYFGLGIRLNSENADHVRPGNVFFYHAGASRLLRKRWRIHGEIKGFNHGSSSVSGATASGWQELYLAGGANYRLSDSRTISSALLIGLTPESHDLGFIISTSF